MIKIGYRVFLALVVALQPLFPAWAGYVCQGTVAGVLVYADGALSVNASYRNEWTKLCNLQAAKNGISTQVCFAWLTAALSAKAYNSDFITYYSDGTYTCATIPTYGNSIPPVYAGVLN